MNKDVKLFTFEHEPKSLKEMVLDSNVRQKLEKFIVEKPNILLHGGPGVGKGTFVNIFLKETGLDYIKINASDENSIDDVRSKIKSFATTMGLQLPKIIVLNENDHLSTQAQAAMRDLIESVQKITRFIFCCNYINKVIPEIQSRCQVVQIVNPPATEVFNHCVKILNKEKIKYDKKVVVEIIKQKFPDIRSIINTIQLNVKDKKLESATIDNFNDLYNEILKLMKEQDIEGIRKIFKNNPVNYVDIYSFLFENVGEFKSPGDAIIEIGESAYRNEIVSIKEIQFMSMIMNMYKKGII